ncbi:MAG: radical SAM protein [Candidatus Methanoperedens sp.]|nr:MAG: radical SAM protein [Candidatus Methanoperedens sp.]
MHMLEVFLNVTGGCNLNCRYCYEKDRMTEKQHPLSVCNYTINDVLKLLEKLSEYKDSIYVYFYGGEPTLKPKLLDEWSSKIKEKYPGVYQVLHTNGLLLDTLPKSFFDNIEVILLSVNMESKIAYGSRDFYVATVRKNIEWIRNIIEIPVILRLTYTSDSHFLETCFLFEDISDAIYWQINSIQDNDIEQTMLNYYTDISMLMNKWFSQLQKPTNLQYIPFDYAFLVTSNTSEFKEDTAPCGFGRSILFVDLDGAIYACPEMVHYAEEKIGHIKTGFDLKPTNDMFIEILEECSNCIAKTYCRTRCPNMHLKSSIDTQKHICTVTRNILEDFLRYKEKLDDSVKKRYLSRIRAPQIRRFMGTVECVP